MSITPVFHGSVSAQGNLTLQRPIDFREHLSQFKEKAVEVIVRRVRSQRSTQANRYYFGVVVPLIAEELGYDKQEMHEVLSMHFLRIEDCPITGAPRRKRTPKCDTKEFSEYVDSCIRLAVEHGVLVPEPHQAEVVT